MTTRFSSSLPWIRIALASEDLYAESPSTAASSTTAYSAFAHRIRLVKLLHRCQSRSIDAQSLASCLGYCSPRARCLSGACPECARALQLFFTRQAMSLLSDERGRFSTLSAIPKPMPTLGNLNTLELDALQYQLKRALKRNGVNLAVGGIDFSLNQQDKTSDGRWAPHFWVVVKNTEGCNWAVATRALYPRSKRTPRPVHIQQWDGNERALLYALKPNFVRRVTYIDGKGRQNTRDDRLREYETAELALFLDTNGLASRVFVIGARPTMTRDGISLIRLKKRNQ